MEDRVIARGEVSAVNKRSKNKAKAKSTVREYAEAILVAVILTLIWVYVSSLVFLAGAEFTRWLIVTDPMREKSAPVP